MAIINSWVSNITSRAEGVFSALTLKFWPLVILDIIIVSILIYWVYLFLRQTRAIRIVYGLLVLIILMLLGRLMDLVLLNWILQYVMAMLVVAIPVVFQPELRNALEKLGRTGLLTDFNKPTSREDVYEQILIAVKNLSSQKIGALIVLQRKTGLRDYFERGIVINANVSAEILTSIFYPKSPLHDGAVIVTGQKIISASVMLPVTEREFSAKYGSRHRAAVGITESSDAISIVVSEETGAVSLAVGGELERRISDDRLKNRLLALMRNQ